MDLLNGIYNSRQTEAVEATDILADMSKLSHELGLDIKIPETMKYKDTFLYVNKSLPANTVMVSEDVARALLLELRESTE